MAPPHNFQTRIEKPGLTGFSGVCPKLTGQGQTYYTKKAGSESSAGIRYATIPNSTADRNIQNNRFYPRRFLPALLLCSVKNNQTYMFYPLRNGLPGARRSWPFFMHVLTWPFPVSRRAPPAGHYAGDTASCFEYI
jgi:hypothetical protein